MVDLSDTNASIHLPGPITTANNTPAAYSNELKQSTEIDGVTGNSVDDYIKHLFLNRGSGASGGGYALRTKGNESRFMMAAGSLNLKGGNSIELTHAHDLVWLNLQAVRIGDNLSGRITYHKDVHGVNWPTNYYYRQSNANSVNTIVPTTDGTDQATSDLRDYMGSSRNMFYHSTERNEQISDTSRAHSLIFPNNNFGQPLFNSNYNDNFLVVFNFGDIDIDVTSFTATVNIIENTGDDASIFSGKTSATFTKISTGRYSITLNGDSNPLKINQVFKNSTHSINLNTGSHTNQVTVNGEVGFNLPYIANSQQIIEFEFADVEVTDS